MIETGGGMKATAYLETTVVGYLCSRLSRDLITAAHQEVTQEWWDTRRQQLELFVSELVVREAGAGDPNAARKRLAALEGIPQLDLNENCRRLARDLLKAHVLPQEAAEDALHVAVAAVHGMRYLVTWNYAHIANAQRRAGIEEVCRDAGYEPPIICTPEELMEEQ
jgi:predicted nucleic acid-binding protein